MLKLIFSICIPIISSFAILAQSGDAWFSFYNQDTSLLGYKDKNGVVKIEPKFSLITNAGKFENIIAAIEEIDGEFRNYYLTKLGKVVGSDSMFILDNGYDCESEGFIRFKDWLNDKIGMFNRNGDVAIPAEYNHLSRVRNGMIIGRIGAEKKYWNNGLSADCGHFSWIGGKTMLLDTNNRVIIENFIDSLYLDFYSHQTQDSMGDKPNEEYFTGNDGKIHKFINYKNDFAIWLNQKLLDSLTLEKLLSASANNITFWKDGKGWVSKPRNELIEKNFLLIKNKLLTNKYQAQNFSIAIDGLNPLIFEGDEYKDYFNDCGESLSDKYPLIKIIFTSVIESKYFEDHFDFLKTDSGYKLICLTIRSGLIGE